jgi:MFS family permease
MAPDQVVERHSIHPPGTVYLVETQQNKVILVPTPSADPEDPLNWNRARKLLNTGLVLFYVFSTGIGGASVYSVLEPISSDTGITLAELVNGTGFLFLLAGWSNLIWQPLALTFGRRPILILSLLGCVAISEWTAWVDKYPAWAAARCMYGFFVAPVEVLPEICIPDIFFAHERGGYIAWYMFVLCGSNFFAPLVAGFLNDAEGWHWVQHWAALVLALNLVLVLLFYEETMYTRGTIEGEGVEELLEPSKEVTRNSMKSPLAEEAQDEPSPIASLVYPRKTYWQKLRLFSPSRLSVGQILTMAYRPILIFFLFPNIMWAGFMYGSALAW